MPPVLVSKYITSHIYCRHFCSSEIHSLPLRSCWYQYGAFLISCFVCCCFFLQAISIHSPLPFFLAFTVYLSVVWVKMRVWNSSAWVNMLLQHWRGGGDGEAKWVVKFFISVVRQQDVKNQEVFHLLWTSFLGCLLNLWLDPSVWLAFRAFLWESLRYWPTYMWTECTVQVSWKRTINLYQSAKF